MYTWTQWKEWSACSASKKSPSWRSGESRETEVGCGKIGTQERERKCHDKAYGIKEVPIKGDCIHGKALATKQCEGDPCVGA